MGSDVVVQQRLNTYEKVYSTPRSGTDEYHPHHTNETTSDVAVHYTLGDGWTEGEATIKWHITTAFNLPMGVP